MNEELNRKQELKNRLIEQLKQTLKEFGIEGLKEALIKVDIFVIAEMNGFIAFEGYPDGIHPVRIEVAYSDED